MEITTITLFQYMYTQYSTGFIAALDADVSQALAAVLPPLSAALVIWIIILGYLMMTGRYDYRIGISKVITMSIVVGIVSSSTLYDTYVQNFFLNDIPNFIATTFSSSGTSNIPQLLDRIYNNFVLGGEIIYKKASCITCILEPYVLGVEIQIILGIFFVALAIVFAIYLITTTLTGVLVVIGPFMIIGFLFDYTKGVADRWLAKLIGLSILLLLTTVVISIFSNGIIDFINTVITAKYDAETVQQELIALGEIAAYTSVVSFLTLLLPSVAAYLGGGVSFSVSSFANPFNWFR